MSVGFSYGTAPGCKNLVVFKCCARITTIVISDTTQSSPRTFGFTILVTPATCRAATKTKIALAIINTMTFVTILRSDSKIIKTRFRTTTGRTTLVVANATNTLPGSVYWQTIGVIGPAAEFPEWCLSYLKTVIRLTVVRTGGRRRKGAYSRLVFYNTGIRIRRIWSAQSTILPKIGIGQRGCDRRLFRWTFGQCGGRRYFVGSESCP